MANPNFKGRPKGSGKSTFIEDPVLGDYKIAIDEYSFNVVDTIKNKTVSFSTSLPRALLQVAKHQMLQEKVFSLEEYAREFKETHEKLQESILK